MRYVWVDEGNNPNYDAALLHNINGFFFDPRDPRVTKAYLQGVADQGYSVGIYLGAYWAELGDTPAKYVNYVKNLMSVLRKNNSFPKVQFDIEDHNMGYVQAILQLWRTSFPWHDTSWSMESFQGGLMSPDFVKAVTDMHVRVCPQYYGGAMQPFAPDRAYRDLIVRGFQPSSISGMYDAARIDPYSDGFFFTQGRLPLTKEIG